MLRTVLGLAARVATGLCSGVLALPRIADALGRLTPLVQALPQVAELRGTLERLEQLATFLANEMPEALHQLEAVQRRLAELEPRIAALVGNTGQLDESIRVLAAALGPLQGTTERLGRLVDRLPDRKRRTQALPGSAAGDR
jgi:ABC-type transporter Mla subunit MlaD